MAWIVLVVLLQGFSSCLTGQSVQGAWADSTYLHAGFDGNNHYFEAGNCKLDMKHFEEAFVKLEVKDFLPCGLPGEPELLAYTELIQSGPLPPGALVPELLDSVVISLDELYAKRSIRPVPDPETKNGEETRAGEGTGSSGAGTDSADRWFGGPVLSITYGGRMREVPVSTLCFSPVRYNPGRNLLVIYTRVRCTIALEPGPCRNRRRNSPFTRLLSRIPGPQADPGIEKALEVERPLGLVVLSDTMFRKGLQPLLNWKRRKGFRVEEVYLQELRNQDVKGIRDHLDSLYRHPPDGEDPPSYLLIVGDVEHVPHSGSGGRISDLYFTTFDGPHDYLPELFCGRISVRDTLQLNAVTTKILEYETYAFKDPSFLDRSLLIAGVDDYYAEVYGNGQVAYLHENYLDGRDGREDHAIYYPGSDTARLHFLDLYSMGLGFVNYTGHGEYDRWRDPSFTLQDIGGLENEGMYPLMVGNGCETNVFSYEECFAEALLRAPARGAIAYIGCTDDSYWEEDYFWSLGLGEVVRNPSYEGRSLGCFDRVFHTHDENYADWAPSVGEMVYWGNMAVQQSSSPRKQMYWEIYQLAGDPTLTPWFGVPRSMHPRYPGAIPTGSSQISIQCDPYAYLALSIKGELLAARHSSAGGLTVLDLPLLPGGSELELVITGPGKQPHRGMVEIGEPGGSYSEIVQYTFSAEGGDPHLHPGMEVRMDLLLVNRGPGSGPVTLYLSEPGMEIEFKDSVCPVVVPMKGDTLHLKDAFCFETGKDLTDGESFWLTVDFQSGRSPVYLEGTIQGPELHSGGIRWEDRSPGNGNGRAEPGEWIHCRWDLFNRGHYRMDSLALGYEGLNHTLFDSLLVPPPMILEAGDSAILEFDLRLSPQAGDPASSGKLVAGWGGGRARDSLYIWPGGYLLDFSREPGTDFPFRGDGDSPWVLTKGHFHSSPSSCRSGNIGHEKESRLILDCSLREAGRAGFMYRVSSEKDYDFLEFSVDGELRASWSGEWDWTPFSLELDSGIHRLEWNYRKDRNTTGGEDAAWVDDIRLPAGTFRNGDLDLRAILNAPREPRKWEGEAFSASIQNRSPDPVSGFVLGYYLEGKDLGKDTFSLDLEPGETVIVQSSTRFILEEAGRAQLGVEMLSDTFSYRGNNFKEQVVERYAFPDLGIAGASLDTGTASVPGVVFFLTNPGNVVMETMAWEYYLDDVLREAGEKLLQLGPGGKDSLVLALLAPGELLLPGDHFCELRILDTDSAAYNNRFREHFMWTLIPHEITGREQWGLFPNPSRNGTWIWLEQPATGKESFRIYSSQGRLCGTFFLPAGASSMEVPVHGYPQGSYIIRRERNAGIRSLLLIR